MTDRTPPNNTEAEVSLLGAMLLTTEAVMEASRIVSAEHFYKPVHQTIFAAIRSVFERGEAIDAVTVADELERVLDRRGRDDGRAVLVVVEHGDVEPLPELALDLEAAWGRDVLEVDAAEALRDPGDRADELVGVAGVDEDRVGVDVGELLRISALDGRQFRDDQLSEVILDPGPPAEGWDDDERTMLGTDQEAWLTERLTSSPATWNCLAQQTILADTRLPGGAILNYDQWDGYHAARERVLANAPSNFVTLTGDIHLAGVGSLGAPEAPVGVEFVTTAISSVVIFDSVRSWRGEKQMTRHSPSAVADSKSSSAASFAGAGAPGSSAAKSFSNTKVDSYEGFDTPPARSFPGQR